MVIICLFVCTAMRGQQMTQKTIDLPDYESSLDVSHFNGALLNNAMFEWAKTRSGADKGARWIDRISNMPDYLLSYYDGYGEKVKEVLNGKSNWLSDPTTAVYDSKATGMLLRLRLLKGLLSLTIRMTLLRVRYRVLLWNLQKLLAIRTGRMLTAS